MCYVYAGCRIWRLNTSFNSDTENSWSNRIQRRRSAYTRTAVGHLSRWYSAGAGFGEIFTGSSEDSGGDLMWRNSQVYCGGTHDQILNAFVPLVAVLQAVRCCCRCQLWVSCITGRFRLCRWWFVFCIVVLHSCGIAMERGLWDLEIRLKGTETRVIGTRARNLSDPYSKLSSSSTSRSSAWFVCGSIGKGKDLWDCRHLTIGVSHLFLNMSWAGLY